MTLAMTSALFFSCPFFMSMFAKFFLKEKIGIRRWSAIFVGFIGVLIIMRPGFSIFDPKSILPLFAALFLSLYQIATRKASEYDSNETSLFFTSFFISQP